MKILFVTHVSNLYGANKSLLDLLVFFKKNHIQTHTLIPQKGRLTDKLDSIGISFSVLPIPWCFSPHSNKKFFYSNSLYEWIQSTKRHIRNKLNCIKLRGLMKDLKPDVVYTHTSFTRLGYELSKCYHIPHIWHIHELGLENYNYRIDYNTNYLYSAIEKSNIIIHNSEYVKDKMKLGSKLQQVIYYGLIKEEMLHNNHKELSFKLIANDSKIQICIVGYLTKYKGQAKAIQAMPEILKNFPNTILRIVGEGEEENSYRSLIKELGLEDSVTIEKTRDNVDEIYKTSDLSLMCSTGEAFGRVTVESMANGCPVIGMNHGGTKEIIIHGFNGLLTENSAESLSQRVIELLSNNELRKSLIANGFTTVKQRFLIDDYGNKIKNAISQYCLNR